MKREIKFRAWNGDEMISPDYINRHGIAYWKENSIPSCTEQVMQYTGLNDKNGKEIYEGDIIPMDIGLDKWNSHVVRNEVGVINGVVEWNNYQQRYIIKYPESKKHNVISTEFGWGGQNFEVIGNIYENPELL